VADRIVAGLGIARKGAPDRVALELVVEHGRPDDPLEGCGADEPARGRGHQDPDGVALLRRQTRQLERLVGGNATGHSEKDPAHLTRPSCSGARS
jgi:hypothetical protein